jgi:hypothetical protein
MVFSLKQINDIVDGNGVISSLGLTLFCFFMNNTNIDGNGFFIASLFNIKTTVID